ncbi:single-stranded DNA-binding protein [Verrucomicrobium spinosum]|uniref:single-stranded DNA-binding protein n=1 Tax=Verrucomicrobium spinosum TaxID=2736 RepID=UPI0009466432|nr:single-stranded DNA-binding protein [Verrucomicrobium spinosum]
MASYNKVMLMGNLTRDPEVRYTPKGSAVADLAIAVNRVYTAENGEKREEVTYVDVVLWARLAELAGQYLHKGRPVFIEAVFRWTSGKTSRLARSAADCAWWRGDAVPRQQARRRHG